MFGDGQTQSCTPCFAGARGIDTVESLENTVQRRFRNADALIDDTNCDLAIATADTDRDGSVVRRIVDGVLHQILHRGFDGLMIGVDEQIILIDSVYGTLDVHQLLLAIQRKHQIDMLRFGLHLVFDDRLAYQRKHGKPFRIQHRSRALRLLQVDQAMHQFRQSFGFLGHTTSEILHHIGIICSIANRFGKQGNRTCRGFQFMRNVRHEITTHDFETTLLAHVGNENRKQIIGNLTDAHMQIQRVGRTELACLNALAVGVLRGRTGGAIQRNRQFTLTHHAVGRHQSQNIADFGKRHRTVFNNAETLRARGHIFDRCQRIDDDQRLRHDGNKLTFRGLHRHARTEQRHVFLHAEQAWIVRIDLILPELHAPGTPQQKGDHSDGDNHNRHRHVLQRHTLTFR